jgi:hypothetical protein
MRTLDDTARLLDLLREAGDEPVTLDELAIVGVPEPARLLQALEREGHPLSRVYDRRADRPVACVRLRGSGEAPAAPAPQPAPSPTFAPSPAAAADRRPLLVAAVVALVLLLLARR